LVPRRERCVVSGEKRPEDMTREELVAEVHRLRGTKAMRYDEREIGRRIEARRRARGVPVAALCEVCGFDKSSWSRKTRVDRSSFTFQEISLIAEALCAPRGWPFIEDEGDPEGEP